MKRVDNSIRSARMEGQCQHRHSTYLSVNGYSFCPWCGKKLIIIEHCTHCGRYFLSREAYIVHLRELDRYKNNPCPEGGKSCSVVFHKNRNKMFCPLHLIEYPLKGN